MFPVLTLSALNVDLALPPLIWVDLSSRNPVWKSAPVCPWMVIWTPRGAAGDHWRHQVYCTQEAKFTCKIAINMHFARNARKLIMIRHLFSSCSQMINTYMYTQHNHISTNSDFLTILHIFNDLFSFTGSFLYHT